MKSNSLKPSGPERVAYLCDLHGKGHSLNIRVADVAALMGLSVSTLNALRLKGGGPRFMRFGRSVRYRLADVMAFINGSPTYASTSEISAPKDRLIRAG